GGVLAALAARRLRRAGARSRLLPLSCAALALALLFAAGEEVSWLQRQLGLATPEPLSAVNLQDELNVHNVLGLEWVVEIAAAAMWVGFALVVPLLARTRGRAGEVVRRHLPVIPLAFGLLFLLNNLMADVAIGVGPQFWRWDSTFPLRHSVTEIEEA